MSKRRKLSRREFLKMVGATASAATLVTCTPPTPTEVTPAATAGPVPEQIEPIVRQGIRVHSIMWKKKPLVMEHKILMGTRLFRFQMVDNDMDYNTFRELSADGKDFSEDPEIKIW